MRITPGGKYGYSVVVAVAFAFLLAVVPFCAAFFFLQQKYQLFNGLFTASLFISLPLQQIVIMANTSIRRFSSQLPRGFYVQQNMFGLNKKLTQKNTLQVTLLVIRNNHKRHAYMYLTVIYS